MKDTISFCMTNGGMYRNIHTINGVKVSTLETHRDLSEIIDKNEKVCIEFDHSDSAIVKTSCISSINL